MMKLLHPSLAASAAVLLAGCASNAPLLFGDDLTYGLKLGNDAATGGATVSLGYKQRSIAVVPVSIIDGAGKASAFKGHGDQGRDALSVFAVFGSKADSAAEGSAANAGQVSLGQVFSTGLAAQALTSGYECRHTRAKSCDSAFVAAPVLALAHDQKEKEKASDDARGSAVAQDTQDAAERPYQPPLVYLRSDVFGFDIGGSVAERGVQFALGSSIRNLALIPVVAVSAGNKPTRLFADDGAEDGRKDAYSVLGQFNATTQTRRLDFGLDRYFATGIAATNLGRGLGFAIAHDASPVQAPPAGGRAAGLSLQTAVAP